MELDFVPVEESLELKDMGYDEQSFGYYVDGILKGVDLGWEGVSNKPPFHQLGGFHMIRNSHVNNPNKVVCCAPMYSQVFNWFREKYELDSAVLKDRFVIETEHNLPKWFYGFKSFNEAQLGCLKQLIYKVKNNKIWN